MSRFRLTQAISISQRRFKAGDVVTDQLPVQVEGDHHVAGLSASTLHAGMQPLDQSAEAMKAASAFANETVRATISGADSVSS
jgi:hypothetical protein